MNLLLLLFQIVYNNCNNFLKMPHTILASKILGSGVFKLACQTNDKLTRGKLQHNDNRPTMVS